MDAGIVDQHVESLIGVLGKNSFKAFSAWSLLAVSKPIRCRSHRLFNGRQSFLSAFGIFVEMHDDRVAIARETNRDFTTDSRRTPCD